MNTSKKSKLNKRIIDYNDIAIGMHVQDDDGNVGIVKDCKDIHNILVDYDDGGSGIHCLVNGCIETAKINDETIEILQYDPLYYCEKN